MTASPSNLALTLRSSTETCVSLNRLAQNLGRVVFREALQSYAEQYGFTIAELELAYSSQECPRCRYVDTRNRKQSKFSWRHCGHTAHADVNAARIMRIAQVNSPDVPAGQAVGSRFATP